MAPQPTCQPCISRVSSTCVKGFDRMFIGSTVYNIYIYMHLSYTYQIETCCLLNKHHIYIYIYMFCYVICIYEYNLRLFIPFFFLECGLTSLSTVLSPPCSYPGGWHFPDAHAAASAADTGAARDARRCLMIISGSVWFPWNMAPTWSSNMDCWSFQMTLSIIIKLVLSL